MRVVNHSLALATMNFVSGKKPTLSLAALEPASSKSADVGSNNDPGVLKIYVSRYNDNGFFYNEKVCRVVFLFLNLTAAY